MPKQPFQKQAKRQVIHPIQREGFRAESLSEDAIVSESEDQEKSGLSLKEFNGVVSVDIEYVRAGKYQPRLVIKQESIDTLALDIARLGRLINPISVIKHSETDYEIVAGERRWLACKSLGLEKIQVQIIDEDEKLATLSAFSENFQREDLSDIEVGFYLKKMLDLGIAKNKCDLANITGIDRRDVYRYLSFSELPKEIHEVILKNPSVFSFVIGEEMLELCKRGFSSKVKQAAQLILQGKLKGSGLREWVLGERHKSDRRRAPIVANGVDIGSLTLGGRDIRIRLNEDGEKLSLENIANAIYAAMLSFREQALDTPDTERS